jgi:hypothetical protein
LLSLFRLLALFLDGVALLRDRRVRIARAQRVALARSPRLRLGVRQVRERLAPGRLLRLRLQRGGTSRGLRGRGTECG